MGQDRVKLREIRERAARATIGPWVASPRHGSREEDQVGGLGWDVDGPPEPQLRGQFAMRDDAEFIASARTDIPFLLNLIEALEAENRDA